MNGSPSRKEANSYLSKNIDEDRQRAGRNVNKSSSSNNIGHANVVTHAAILVKSEGGQSSHMNNRGDYQ